MRTAEIHIRVLAPTCALRSESGGFVLRPRNVNQLLAVRFLIRLAVGLEPVSRNSLLQRFAPAQTVVPGTRREFGDAVDLPDAELSSRVSEEPRRALAKIFRSLGAPNPLVERPDGWTLDRNAVALSLDIVENSDRFADVIQRTSEVSAATVAATLAAIEAEFEQCFADPAHGDVQPHLAHMEAEVSAVYRAILAEQLVASAASADTAAVTRIGRRLFEDYGDTSHRPAATAYCGAATTGEENADRTRLMLRLFGRDNVPRGIGEHYLRFKARRDDDTTEPHSVTTELSAPSPRAVAAGVKTPDREPHHVTAPWTREQVDAVVLAAAADRGLALAVCAELASFACSAVAVVGISDAQDPQLVHTLAVARCLVPLLNSSDGLWTGDAGDRIISFAARSGVPIVPAVLSGARGLAASGRQPAPLALPDPSATGFRSAVQQLAEVIARQPQNSPLIGAASLLLNPADRRAQEAVASSQVMLGPDMTGVALRDRVLSAVHDLRSILDEELWRQLGWPQIASRARADRRVADMESDPLMLRLIPRFDSLRALHETERRKDVHTGFHRNLSALRDLTERRPLRIAIPPSLLGAAAILAHLVREPAYSLALDLRFDFTHAAALIETLDMTGAAPPDGMAVLLAPAYRLLTARRASFRPWATLPGQSYRVAAAADTNHATGVGPYFAPIERTTGASIQLQRLADRSAGSRTLREAHHVEPDEILLHLARAAGDAKYLLWHPHWRLSHLLGLGSITPEIPQDSAFEEVVFLLSDDFVLRHPTEAALLTAAIRAAWLDLIEEPRLRQLALSFLIDHSSYARCFRRMLGITPLLFHA